MIDDDDRNLGTCNNHHYDNCEKESEEIVEVISPYRCHYVYKFNTNCAVLILIYMNGIIPVIRHNILVFR